MNARRTLNIGPQMKRIRLERGVTHRDLAVAAQVTIGTISRIENGEHEPRAAIMAAIADRLGVTMDELRTPRVDTPNELETQLIDAARRAQAGDAGARAELRRLAVALGEADSRRAGEVASSKPATRRKGT
jgi:transcriptional regulator with XRE-family HTH domain